MYPGAMIELDWKRVPKVDKNGFKYPKNQQTFELTAAVTDEASVQGSTQLAAYEMNPVIWAKATVDGAKEDQVFAGAFQEQVVDGHTLVIPNRKGYLASGSWNTDSDELAVNTNITWTTVDTIDGVQFTPEEYMWGVEVTNKAIRESAANVVTWMREECLYHQLDYVDTLVSASLAGATYANTGVNYGMMTIFGGNATSVSNTLDAGDTLTTDMVAKAKRLLASTATYYWDAASTDTWTKATSVTNPWQETPGKPLMLFMAPEQAEAFETDSQFVNASEYGGREVVLNGEFTRYLGVKFIKTSKTPAIAAAGNFSCEGQTVTVDVPCHTPYMVKSQVCGAVVWGQKPRLYVYDWPSGMKKRFALNMAVIADTIQNDAIIRMVVADE